MWPLVTGLDDDDDGPEEFRPVPHPDDRLWRHPSEIAAMQAAHANAETAQVPVVSLSDPAPSSRLNAGLKLAAGLVVVGAGALTIGARLGRDRPGAHPHLAEIGVIDPLWIRTATQRVRRLGPQKIKPKSPWQIMVTRPRPTAGQPAVTP